MTLLAVTAAKLATMWQWYHDPFMAAKQLFCVLQFWLCIVWHTAAWRTRQPVCWRTMLLVMIAASDTVTAWVLQTAELQQQPKESYH